MDQLLKARKMGSAAARRQKLQEREREVQQQESRRQRKLLYGYSSSEEESSDEEGSPTFSPIIDDHSNDTGNSASEDESSPISHRLRAPFSSDAFVLSVQETKTSESDAPNQKFAIQLTKDPHLLSAPNSPALMRDPTIVDNDDASTIDYYTDMSGAEDDFQPPPSPGIPYTAESVHYLMPMARPSIVSIRQSLPPLQTTSDALSPCQPFLSPPPRSAKRLSSASSVPTLTGSVATSHNSVNVATPIMTSPPTPSMESEIVRSPQQMESDVSLPSVAESKKRPGLKSSKQPSFTEETRPNTSHGGSGDWRDFSSRQSVVRTSLDSPPRTSSVSTNASTISLKLPRQRMSIMTPRSNSNAHEDVPSIPTPRPSQQLPRSYTQPIAAPPSPTKSMQRKKSFSGLRSRSESIGKAFRQASSSVKSRGRFPVVPTTTDSPPVPQIRPELKRQMSEQSSQVSLVDSRSAAPVANTPAKSSLSRHDTSAGFGLRSKSSRLTMSIR